MCARRSPRPAGLLHGPTEPLRSGRGTVHPEVSSTSQVERIPAVAAVHDVHSAEPSRPERRLTNRLQAPSWRSGLCAPRAPHAELLRASGHWGQRFRADWHSARRHPAIRTGGRSRRTRLPVREASALRSTCRDAVSSLDDLFRRGPLTQLAAPVAEPVLRHAPSGTEIGLQKPILRDYAEAVAGRMIEHAVAILA